MPAIALLILQGIQAAIQAAPGVLEIVKKGKDFISSLISGGIITVDQQKKLHARVDQIADDFANGRVPAAWMVEADPDSE